MSARSKEHNLMDATTPMLELRDVYKSFGDVEVLKGISAKIDKSELLTFVGPSGCGKTTLLRIVGGFTTATSGQVILDGEDIGKLPPNMRDTKMVFQSYALFPHMNVRKNIGFGLKLQKWPKDKIDNRVEELLALVHMEGLGDRTIDRISGVGPWIGLLISVIAIVAIVMSIRRFWRADHSKRWQPLGMVSSVLHQYIYRAICNFTDHITHN